MFSEIRGPMKEIHYNPHHRISFKTTPHETRTEDVVCFIAFCVVVVKSAYALRPKSLIYSVILTFLSLIFFLTIRFFIISAWNWSRQLWSFDVLNRPQLCIWLSILFQRGEFIHALFGGHSRKDVLPRSFVQIGFDRLSRKFCTTLKKHWTVMQCMANIIMIWVKYLSPVIQNTNVPVLLAKGNRYGLKNDLLQWSHVVVRGRCHNFDAGPLIKWIELHLFCFWLSIGMTIWHQGEKLCMTMTCRGCQREKTQHWVEFPLIQTWPIRFARFYFYAFQCKQ